MKDRVRIQALVLLGIAALFASAGIRTQSLTLPNLGDLGKALSAVVLIAASYDWLLWRWLPLPGRPPVLRGTWKMLLLPVKGHAGASMAPKPCYLSIRQTASAISAKLLFDDAQSKVTTAILIKEQLGRTLLFFYDFEPKNPTPESPRRKGAVSLDIADGELTGRYWNDVGTWGHLTSEGHTKKLYETFGGASQGGYS